MLIERDRSRLLMVDIQDKLLAAVQSPERIIQNGKLLLKGAGEFAIPVAVSEQYPKGIGHTVSELAELVSVNCTYEKIEFSCFANPSLRETLDSPGRQTVIFGIEAHVCILQTAIDMAEAGHDVTVVADAISSRNEENKDLALRRMENAGVRLASTEMVLFEWMGRAGTDSFKRLIKLIR